MMIEYVEITIAASIVSAENILHVIENIPPMVFIVIHSAYANMHPMLKYSRYPLSDAHEWGWVTLIRSYSERISTK